MAKTQHKNGSIPKILIGVPILSWSHEFAMSFLKFWTDLMTYQHKGRRFHVAYKFAYRRPVQMAQEELAEAAIALNCTHILLMDDDIYDVTAEDFLKLLDADKDVVGGIMFTSGFPYAMCAFRRFNRRTKVADQPILKGPARLYEIPPEQRKGLQPVDLIPFGFTLIKTSIFKKLKKPWFTCNTQAPTDSFFADRMLNKRFDYFAHFDVWLNHRGITNDTRPFWFNLGMAQQYAKDNSSIINLSHEEMRKHEIVMQQKLDEAEKKAQRAEQARIMFLEKSSKRPIASKVKESLNGRNSKEKLNK